MAVFAEKTEEETSPFPHISLTELRQAQNVDEILGVWLTAMRKLCKALQDDMGHQGYEKTLGLIRSRFFWPGMSKDVESWVHHWGRCLRFKGKPDRAPLVGIQTSEPLELVCTDFLKVDSAQNGTQYILVITDHFTRFAMAVPTRNMSAKTTAEALLTFVRNFGIPKRLHADQGANFESKVIRALCHLLGVEKSRTTPFHPMGNGSCERMNQTLISMLGTLPERRKKDWTSYIGMLVLAYNSTKCDSTGFSPYFLMFGREPRLPVDNMFPLCSEPRGDYITNVKEALEWAWAKASENGSKAKESQKNYYDKRVRGAALILGDKVLVRNCSFEGPHKLQDKWSEDIFVVKEQPDSRTPVFVVEPVNGGRKRTLHRNLLLPVESVREDCPDVSPANVATRKALPSVKTNRIPGSISAMPQQVLHEDEVKGTTSELEQEDDGESDLDESEFVQIFSEPEVQRPGSRPRALSRDIAAQSDESDDTVGGLIPLDTLLPVTPRPGSPPPIPVPRRSVRLKQPPAWHTSGEFSMSLNDKLYELKSLLAFDGVDKSIITTAIVSLLVETMSQRVQEWERKRLGNPRRQNRMNQLSYAVGGSYPPEDNARIGPKSPSFHMSHQ
ncbi:hypothetical protein RRG08_013739 [Elysia crispata]|uniref:Integrase catalytic domain-containing protein n=1 Tax=Elysia crispata TaxID=231223 RepID=A0AAE0ZPS9_9GAST|nr:hypothetical protein RRG08_013739 [Elysia crispata]